MFWVCLRNDDQTKNSPRSEFLLAFAAKINSFYQEKTLHHLITISHLCFRLGAKHHTGLSAWFDEPFTPDINCATTLPVGINRIPMTEKDEDGMVCTTLLPSTPTPLKAISPSSCAKPHRSTCSMPWDNRSSASTRRMVCSIFIWMRLAFISFASAMPMALS